MPNMQDEVHFGRRVETQLLVALGHTPTLNGPSTVLKPSPCLIEGARATSRVFPQAQDRLCMLSAWSLSGLSVIRSVACEPLSMGNSLVIEAI